MILILPLPFIASFLTDCLITASDCTEGRSGQLDSAGREVV